VNRIPRRFVLVARPAYLWLALALAFHPSSARAQAAPPAPAPKPQAGTQTMSMDEAKRFFHAGPAIYDGANELGLSFALVSIEGDSHSSLGLRLGTFRSAGDGLLGYEVGFADTRGDGIHVLDYDGELTWQRALQPGVYPMLAIGGGVRQRRQGGEQITTHPVGGGVGFRTLFGDQAAIRVEYRYRRVLNDPVEDFTEHQVWVSFSLLFHNRPSSNTAVPPRRR